MYLYAENVWLQIFVTDAYISEALHAAKTTVNSVTDLQTPSTIFLLSAGRVPDDRPFTDRPLQDLQRDKVNKIFISDFEPASFSCKICVRV